MNALRSGKLMNLVVLILSLSASQGALAESAQVHKMDRKVVSVCKRVMHLPASDSAMKSDQVSEMQTCVKNYRVNLHACVATLASSAQTTPSYRKCQSTALAQVGL